MNLIRIARSMDTAKKLAAEIFPDLPGNGEEYRATVLMLALILAVSDVATAIDSQS